MKKRYVAIALALSLILSHMPMGIWAEDEPAEAEAAAAQQAAEEAAAQQAAEEAAAQQAEEEAAAPEEEQAPEDMEFSDGPLLGAAAPEGENQGPAALTVGSIVIGTKTYDGGTEAAIVSYTLNGVQDGDEVTLTGTAAFADALAGTEKPVHVTNLTLGGAQAGNYVLGASEFDTTGTIEKAPLDETWITAPAAAEGLIYSGSAQSLLTAPGSCTIPGDNALTAAAEYSLAPEGPFAAEIPVGTDAAVYSVYYRIPETENHLASAAGKLDVEIAKFEASYFVNVVMNNRNIPYTGSEIHPTPDRVYLTWNDDSTQKLDLSQDQYTLKWIDPDYVNCGDLSFILQVRSCENFAFVSSDVYESLESFRIIPRSVSQADMTISVEQAVYNGAALTPAVTVKDDQGRVVPDSEYILAWENNRDAGTGIVSVIDLPDGSYSLETKEQEFPIEKAPTTFTVQPAAVEGLVYDGQPHELFTEGQGSRGSVQYAFDEAFTQPAAAVTDAGSYTVYAKIPGNANYADSEILTLNCTIAPLAITPTVTVADSGLVYTGSPLTPQVTVMNGESTLTAGSDFTLAWANHTDAGEAARVTVTGCGNYSFTAEKTFTIQKAKRPAPEDVFPAEGIHYDGQLHELVTGPEDGTVLYRCQDGVWSDYSSSLPRYIAMKDYTVQYYAPALDSNHLDSDPVSVCVSIGKAYHKADLIHGPEGTGVYTGEPQPVITTGAWADGFDPANPGPFAAVYSLSPEGPFTSEIPMVTDCTPVTVYWQIPQNAFYLATEVQSTVLSLQKKAVTVSVSFPEAQNFVYTGKALTAPVQVTTEDGTVLTEGVDYTLSWADNVDASAAATVTASMTETGNYTFAPAVLTFSIGKAPLKACVENQTVVVGSPAPAYPIHYIGLQNGETEPVYVNPLPNPCIYDPAIHQTAGEQFPISYGLTTETELKNYVFTEVSDSAVLTVIKLTPQVTAPTAASPVYNGQAQALLQDPGATTGGTLQYSLQPEGPYAAEIPTASEAGSYQVYYRVLGDGNTEDVPAASIAVTIGKAAPAAGMFTVSNLELLYNGESQSPQVTVREGITGMGAIHVTTSAVNVRDCAGLNTVLFETEEGSNYLAASLELPGEFRIQIRELPSVTLTLDRTVFLETGSEITPAVTVKAPDGSILGNGEYTVVYENNLKASADAAVKVTPAAHGNYSFPEAAAAFTIRSAAEIRTTDLEKLQNLRTDLEKQIGSASEAEKPGLQEELQLVEAEIRKIENANAAADTEAIRKADKIREDQVQLDDEQTLLDGKADLEKALKDYGDLYDSSRKQALQDQLKAVNAMLEALEAVKTCISDTAALPETAAPDADAETEKAIEDALAAYAALSDHQKELLKPQYEKLQKLHKGLVDYQVLDGIDGVWHAGDGDVTFRFNGRLDKFTGLMINGEEVAEENYSLQSGSTIVILKESFAKTLEAGEYTLTPVYVDSDDPDAGKPYVLLTVGAYSEKDLKKSLTCRDLVAGYDIDTVRSSDCKDIEKAVEDMEELADKGNIPDSEKELLKESIAQGEKLLARIQEAAEALKTESILAVKNTDKDNVLLKEKNTLLKAEEDYRKALETYPENYTDEELKAVQAARYRISDALDAIYRAETEIYLISSLPSFIGEEDHNAMRSTVDAVLGYNCLTKHERFLVGTYHYRRMMDLYSQFSQYHMRGADDQEERASMEVSGPYDRFMDLRIDGKSVDEKDYEVREVKNRLEKKITVITLSKELTEQLGKSRHSIEVDFRGGIALGHMRNGEIYGDWLPKTGDEFKAMTWMLLLTASALGIGTAGVLMLKKKKQ